LLGIPSVRVAGGLAIAAGVASLVESFARFAVEGRGTPAPVAAPTRLVISGQYRYVRNPMYVALLAIVLGEGLALGAVVLFRYAAVLWLLFHLFVTLYEEPALGFRFGSSYQVYRQNVGRWWPRVGPWDP